jgi:hypothetical protein
MKQFFIDLFLGKIVFILPFSNVQNRRFEGKNVILIVGWIKIQKCLFVNSQIFGFRVSQIIVDRCHFKNFTLKIPNCETSGYAS